MTRLRRWAFLLLLPVVPLAADHLDARRGAFSSERRLLYFQSGAEVRRLGPGFHDLLADLYWLRTVQYYGYQRAFVENANYELLLPLVDITTTLDPRLEIAYRYGATFLAEPWPIGAGDPRAAVELLERGVRQLPRSWRLRLDLGQFYFIFLKDAPRASEVLRQASRLPEAPPFLPTLAAALLVKGGERKAARALWSQLAEQAEPGPMKNNALIHIAIVDALDRLDSAQAASDDFARRTGRHARTLSELRASGLLGVPGVDPTRVPFDYNPETGKMSISRSSILYRRQY